jgi:hypothetical protein
MNIPDNHPAMKWQNKMNMYETRNKATEQDTALIPLFKFYGKSFDSDLEQRALYANKLKDLGFTHKDISTAVDEIVTRMDKLPTLSEFMQFLPRHNNEKQVFYASQSKEAEYERKTIEGLKNEFKALGCENDDSKYKELMQRAIKAWFIKVYEYSERDFEELRKVTPLMVFERCILMDWRDANFDVKKIFEVAKQKREKLKDKSHDQQVATSRNQSNHTQQKHHPTDVPF